MLATQATKVNSSERSWHDALRQRQKAYYARQHRLRKKNGLQEKLERFEHKYLHRLLTIYNLIRYPAKKTGGGVYCSSIESIIKRFEKFAGETVCRRTMKNYISDLTKLGLFTVAEYKGIKITKKKMFAITVSRLALTSKRLRGAVKDIFKRRQTFPAFSGVRGAIPYIYTKIKNVIDHYVNISDNLAKMEAALSMPDREIETISAFDEYSGDIYTPEARRRLGINKYRAEVGKNPLQPWQDIDSKAPNFHSSARKVVEGSQGGPILEIFKKQEITLTQDDIKKGQGVLASILANFGIKRK